MTPHIPSTQNFSLLFSAWGKGGRFLDFHNTYWGYGEMYPYLYIFYRVRFNRASRSITVSNSVKNIQVQKLFRTPAYWKSGLLYSHSVKTGDFRHFSPRQK